MTRASRRKRPLGTSVQLCALASCAIPFAAASGAWDTVSDVSMGVESNDNPRLGQRQINLDPGLVAIRDHTSVRAVLDARFRLSDVGQRGSAYLEPRIRADTYADSADQDLQRRDAYLYASGQHRWQRANIGAAVNLAHESILSSELIDTGLRDLGGDTTVPIVGTDTGNLVLLEEHRNRAIVSPYANFDVSERSSIGVDASYLDVRYSGAQFRGRSDISETEFGASLSRTIDDRTGAGARIYVSDFTGEVTNNETHTVGVAGRFSRKLNEIWSFDFATGVERSAFNFLSVDGSTVDNASVNWTLDFDLQKHTDLATVTFALLRAMDPSATGFMTERDELRFLYVRQMSQRLSARLALRAVQTNPLNDSEQVSGRNIARLGFELAWLFTPTWSVNFGYEAISQKFDDPLRAEGNANLFSVGINYRGLAKPNR